MKKAFLSLLIFALAGLSYADNDVKNNETVKAPVPMIELSGTVIDIHSGEALAGVEVNIEGTDLKAYTDFDGNFKFENIKQGNYNVIASYISYKRSLIENFSANQENHELNIKLEGAN